MLDITPLKILIVLLVALVVLGPERLPGIAHQAARAWGDIRRFRDHVETEVRGVVSGETLTRRPEAQASGENAPGNTGPAASPARGDGSVTEPPPADAGVGREAGTVASSPGSGLDAPSLN